MTMLHESFVDSIVDRSGGRLAGVQERYDGGAHSMGTELGKAQELGRLRPLLNELPDVLQDTVQKLDELFGDRKFQREIRSENEVVYVIRYYQGDDIVTTKITLNSNIRLSGYVRCRVYSVISLNACNQNAYPVAEMIAALNTQENFIAFKYDRKSGQISCEYTFFFCDPSRTHDVDFYIAMTVHGLLTRADRIRKVCLGVYSEQERDEIYYRMIKLIEKIRPSSEE